MILVCPSCKTRYVVNPHAIGPQGRRVKCARCAEVWRAEPPPPEVMEATPLPMLPLRPHGSRSSTSEPRRPAEPSAPPPTSPVPELRSEGPTEPVPAPSPIPTPPIEPPGPPQIVNLPARIEPRRPRTPATAWVILGLGVGGLLAAGFVGRDALVGLWPPAAKLYEAVGIRVANPFTEPGIGEGLALMGVMFRMVDDGQGRALLVSGQIANVGTLGRTVPQLSARLIDEAGETVAFWAFTVQPAELAPGDAVAFETRFPDPPSGIANLEIKPWRD